MKRLPKQAFTLEFKQAAVRQVEVDKRRPAEVARELGVIEQTLHTWLKAHRLGKLSGATANSRPITAEQMEMSRVLAENARLKTHLELSMSILLYRQIPWLDKSRNQ